MRKKLRKVLWDCHNAVKTMVGAYEWGCNWERIIWAKENPTPFCNGHYLKDKEYCLYFWETGVNPEISYKTGRTVYLKKGMLEKDKWGHPTAKPQDIIENLIRNSSHAGGGRA